VKSIHSLLRSEFKTIILQYFIHNYKLLRILDVQLIILKKNMKLLETVLYFNLFDSVFYELTKLMPNGKSIMRRNCLKLP